MCDSDSRPAFTEIIKEVFNLTLEENEQCTPDYLSTPSPYSRMENDKNKNENAP